MAGSSEERRNRHPVLLPVLIVSVALMMLVLLPQTVAFSQKTNDDLLLKDGGLVLGKDALWSSVTWILGGGKKRTESEQALNLEHIKEENDWKNSLVTWMFPEAVQELCLGNRFLGSWIRNWFLATTLYFVVGAIWAYYCYFCFGDSLYPSRDHIPSMKAMVEQMRVAFFAMPLYALLPAITEYIVEQGWTMSYARIDDVGVGRYCLYFALYMTSVEFFVYWQHRLLHDIRPGYKYLHHIHHIYNKEHTLSPFAGLAFHPLDGILQAVPYTWTLFFVPMHFLTHELLLFATAIWTTNIHDCIHVRMDPIMGAGYHTIHHTTYKHNYGHYFWYMDKLMGTLIYPEEYEERKKNGKAV
jgi:lathosterol oxidase